MYINKSLTFLEQVIVALADRRREHIPFRQSKLTHCLKDSIGGSSNTLLVANIWGEAGQVEETVSNYIDLFVAILGKMQFGDLGFFCAKSPLIWGNIFNIIFIIIQIIRIKS